MAISDADLRAAEGRMTELVESGSVAVAAHYDRGRGRVVIRLSTGIEVMFAPQDAQGLAGAKAAQLDQIEVSPTGLGLHFPKLDADLYVPALLAGRLGSARWMAAHGISEAGHGRRKMAATGD